jgi:hypothetical protein
MSGCSVRLPGLGPARPSHCYGGSLGCWRPASRRDRDFLVLTFAQTAATDLVVALRRRGEVRYPDV